MSKHERGPSRRTIVLSAAGLVGAVAIGAGIQTRRSDARFILSILERLLGTFHMDADEFDAFATAHRESLRERYWTRAAPFLAIEAFGSARFLERMGPSSVAHRIERFERELLALFMTTTDYLVTLESPGVPVRFVGGGGCNNPFADLSLPANLT